MENNQDPQRQNSEQPTNQNNPSKIGNPGNNQGNTNNRENTDANPGRNYSEESSNTGKDNKEWDQSPVNSKRINDAPVTRNGDRDKTKNSSDDEQEYGNKEYPHERKAPKAGDDTHIL